MNCYTRFSAPPLAVLVMMLAGCVWSKGQTAPVAALGTRMPSAGFISAPGLKLSDIPSGVVSTDLDGDGRPDLVVAFASIGKVVVYLGAGMGKFQAPVAYSAGGHPVALAALDVNGDGQPDIVTANGADGTVSVLLGRAGGKLGTASILSVGVSADYLAVGDLNGDGLQDVVVASRSGKALAILLNDSHGALQAAAIQALGKTSTGLVVGDFNGDRHVDAAVASDDGTVEVMLGGGDGTLRRAGSFAVSTANIGSLAVADFNRDGSLDLAVTQADGRLLTAFLGKGDGTFGQGVSYAVGNVPVFTAATDVNGDGIVDLLTVNQGSNTVSVLLGKGDGSFQNENVFAVGDGPVALAAGDFYGTGIPGLVVLDGAGKTVNAIAGRGDGTFKAAPSYSGDLSPKAIASGDLNGDGVPDLVVANFCGSDAACAKSGSLSVYLGQASGGYKLASTQAVGVGPVSVALADLNGDGNLDVVALNRGDKTLSVLLGVGDGTLREPSTTALVGSPVAVVAKDFNQDGPIDLAVLSDCGAAKCAQPGSVDVYFGGGNGSFALGASYAVSYSPRSIAAGDLNGDGVLDLVVANACGKDATCSSTGTATVLLGGVKGSFAAQADIALNKGPSSIALWSAKSKGVMNIVVTHEADNTVAVLKGNGDGTFEAPSLYAVGGSPGAITIADLNGDGTPDVAVANAKDSTVSVLYGSKDGTLVAGDSYAVAAGPEALTSVAEVAGARASLVTANGNSASTPLGSEITSLVNASPNVGSAPSSTSLAITATNASVNSGVTLTATVTDATTSLPLIGETVGFTSDVASSSDGTTITDCAAATTDANGMVSCTTSELTAGSRTVTATFNGDSTYAASSRQQTQSISMASTTMSLTSASTPMVNQPATFTATLNGTFTPTAASGTITFTRLNGSAIQGCPVTNISGAVPSPTCTITPTAAGAPDIMVSFSGDSNFSGSTGTSSQTVSKIPATLTLVVPDPNAVVTVNQPVTFTANFSTGNATITPTAPNGTIAFTVTGAIVSSCAATTPVTTATATATCTVTPTATGTLSVIAAYTDANYGVAVTANSPVTQTISKIPATLTLVVPDPNAVVTVNQPVTFTANFSTGNATITPTAPNGTIAFTVTGAIVSSCAATTPVAAATSTATCTVTPTAAGTLSVSAAYTDANYAVAATANSPVTQIVSKIPATLTLVVPNPNAVVTVNQPVTFTANFSTGNATITPTPPNGTIAFTVTGAIVSSCAATTPVTTATATATCTVTPTAAGTLSVTAAYTDANYAVATTANSPITQTISPIPATLTVASSAPSSSVNQQVTLTATLSIPSGKSFTPTAPSQMISFTANGTAIPNCGSMTPSGNPMTATCTTSALPAGSYTIVASYNSDPNYTVGSNGNSPSITQTVAKIAASLALSGPSAAMTVNQPVTFTANFSTGNAAITPIAPNGTITFSVTGAVVSACGTTLVNSGSVTASCAVTPTAAGSLTVTASYADANYSAVPTPAFLTQTVNKITPTLSLAFSSNPSPAVVNEPVTYTATVVSAVPGTTLPAGSVTFTQGGVAICGLVGLTPSLTSPTTSSTATCNVTFSSQGASPAVTATYNGDSNFNPPSPSSTTASSFTVGAAMTATTLASTGSSSTPVVNQNVTFTATITPQFTGSAMLGGTVTFTDQASSLPLCSNVSVTLANSIGTASCTSPLSSQGAHNIQAAFNSSTLNFSNSNATLVQMVNPENSAITLSASPASATVNQQVTFTATVTKADATFPGNTAPQGNISFSENGTTIGTCGAVVLASGTASCTVTFANATTHNIKATFNPTTNFTASTTTMPEAVSQAPTTLTLNALPAPSSVNQAVVFTATLTPSPAGNLPTGSITFVETQTGTSGNTLCASINLVASTGGSVTASCSATFLSAGAHLVQASYASDGNFMQNTASVTQTVKVTNVNLTLSSTQTASVVGQPVAFTISLTSAQSGMTYPKGTITVMDGTATTALCTGAVNPDGTVTPACSINSLAPGSHSLVATYAGDTNFTAASSSVVPLIVSQARTTVTVTPPASASVVNQSINFAAVVLPSPIYPGAGPLVPTGKVSFFSGSTFLCQTAIVNADGTSSCPASPGPAATYPITATYTGDANFGASSTTASVPQTVAPGATLVALTSPLPTSVATRSVTFSATLSVAPPSVAGTVPTLGTISFSAPGGVLASGCTQAASVSTAAPTATYTCSIMFPTGTGGPFAVTAAFTPSNGNFQAATSAPVMEAVQDFAPKFTQSVTTANVFVTQTSSTVNDPLFPSVLSVSVSPVPNATFVDSLTYACASPGAGLTCTPTPSGSSTSASVVVSASSAAVPGIYPVTVIVTDSTTPALSHSVNFSVQVNALTSSLNLTAGATGSLQVPFPSGLSLSPMAGTTNYCASYVVNGTLLPTSATGVGITCTGTIPQASNGSIAITITTKSAASASLKSGVSSRISFAAIFGVPIFLLANWRRRKVYLRGNWRRSIGVLSILVSLYGFTGCGGGFTTIPQTGVATAAATYQLVVIAADPSGKPYYAIVPVVVNQ